MINLKLISYFDSGLTISVVHLQHCKLASENKMLFSVPYYFDLNIFMAAALKSCNFTKVVLKPIPVLENDFDTAL